MRIHLHLGAHKTATTFIQSQLLAYREDLARAGIGIVGIAQLRQGFTKYFELLSRFDWLLAPIVRPILRRRIYGLLDAHRGCEVVILSDEDIAGVLRANYRSGGLYRSLGPRARLMKSILKDHDVQFFFAIRNYPDYLTSAFLQMVVKGRAPGFSRYLSRLPASMPGWSEAVADIAAAIGPENLTAWTYDWFKRDRSRIFNLLAPGARIEMPEEELERDVLSSLTRKGFTVMQLLEGHLSKGELTEMGKLLRHFPFDAPNERLEIADARQVEQYRLKYTDDFKKIRALGVRFLHELDDESGAEPR